MSPNVGNFVHDLVEMAKAMETLPGVQAELEAAQDMIQKQGSVIAGREETILKLKSEIEAMQAKVREAEAGRDQAETMFLELDEKAHKVLRALASIQTEAADMERELNPPKPEPIVEAKPEPVYPWTAEQTASDFNTAVSVSSPPSAEPSPIQTDAPSTPAPAEVATSTGGAGEGVSVPQGEQSAPSIDSQSPYAHSTVENTEPARGIESGESVVHPTQAPPAATGIGPEPAQSVSEEPTKYEWVNGIKHTRQAWFDWYDSQPYEYKKNYDWNVA